MIQKTIVTGSTGESDQIGRTADQTRVEQRCSVTIPDVETQLPTVRRKTRNQAEREEAGESRRNHKDNLATSHRHR